MRKWIRSVAVLASAGLLMGAIVGGTPAEAAKRRCKKFKPGTPITDSSTDGVKSAKVKKITDKYTAKKPLTIKFSHGPAAWLLADPEDPTAGQRAIVEDTKWFNFQVDSKKRFVGLYVRQEWPTPSASDLDLYMYDRSGSQVGSSGEFNAVPGTGLGTGEGGMGFEQISGYGAVDCTGYTVESRAFTTHGENVTLTVWLGSIR